jgi:hypothetical protein
VLTEPFTEAVAEAEKVVAEAPHVRGQQDLAEGYDFPFFVRSTGPHTKLGLDNPDTLYLHANIRDDAEYVVTGRRGTTADLSFQVLGGDYTPVDVPDSLAAFDDREIDCADDGSFEVRFCPPGAPTGPNRFTLGEDSAMLVVREVYSDWSRERPGTLRIHRADRVGRAPAPVSTDLMAKRFGVAGKLLLGRLRTFLAFPEWYYLNLPVNTMTEPRVTPGGLSTQYSSVGHYDLADDEVMVVSVPASEAPYQGIQLGSMWYVSLDYVNHQTSLTAAQARTDPDGRMRFVVSERDPGLVNWLERTGHARGYVQIRWQRLSRALGPADGPDVEVVRFDELPDRLPYHGESRCTSEEYAARIAARQAATAERMLG